MKHLNISLRALLVCAVLMVGSCTPLTGRRTPQVSAPGTAPPAGTEVAPGISSTPYSPPEHRISIRLINGVGEFYDRLTGEKFIPRGMNYVYLGPQADPYGQSTIYHAVFDPGKYDSLRVATALSRMHADGYNVVRVFLSQNTIGTISAGLSTAYMENIADFLYQAGQNQVYVMFTQDWLPGGKYGTIINRDCCTDFTMMNLNYLSPAGLEANVAFFTDFVQALIDLHAPLDAIFSYELRNELFFDTDQPPLSLTRGKITTGNGKTYDMASPQDQEDMVAENLVFWIDTMRAAILEKDPTALVSVGFFHPQEPHPTRIGDPRLAVTAPAIWQSQADFIDLHPYPGFELNLEQYVENYGIDGMQQKPIIMGEFGGEISRFASISSAAQKFIDWQVESCLYGFDGWIFWTWDDPGDSSFFDAQMDDGRIEKALAPLTRPDACAAGTVPGAPTNLARGAAVTASSYLPDQPPSNVVDGAFETQWGSGSDPAQWIDIDLGKPFTITAIRLAVAQYPGGMTTHQVWAGSSTGSLAMVHEFKGSTSDTQILEVNFILPLADIQVIRIVTTQSPSWVAWREIEVLGK